MEFGAYEGKDKCLNFQLYYGNLFVLFDSESELGFCKILTQKLIDLLEKEGHHVALAVLHKGAYGQFYKGMTYMPFLKN